MSTATVTVDDFESIIQYSKNIDFYTPDPSDANVVQTEKDKGYYRGTWHLTNVTGAYWSLNFTGTDITVYGDKSGVTGTYEVTLDGNTTSYSAYVPSNGCISCVLFQQGGLTAGPVHEIKMTNGNASMLLDWIKFTTDVGAPGTTVKNTTVEETDPALTYTGSWGHNNSPLFSGGGSTFTNSANASVSLTFNGSAIYVWGDTNANHGQYSVTLDSIPAVTMTAVTGCGLPYQTKGVCEQIIPGLLFFQSYLSPGMHTIKLENIPGVNPTFFDLDRFTYSTPEQYFASSNSTSGGGSSTTTKSAAPSSTHSTGAAQRLLAPSITPTCPSSAALMLALCVVWITAFMRMNRL